MPMGTLIGAAVFLIAGLRIRQIVSASPPLPRDHMPAFIAVQLGAFLGFLILTAAMFRPVQSAMDYPGTWVTVWLAAAAATGLLWLRALIPWRTIIAILHGAGLRLLSGVAVGAAAWKAGDLMQSQWWNLQLTALSGATLNGAAAVLRLFDPIVTADQPSFTIRDGNFAAQVSKQCSGYEGIGLMWVFLAAYFWMFRSRLRFPQALLLVPAATFLIWVANMMRIAALVYIGAHFSPAVAVGGFHSFAGTVLFAAISIATVLFAERSAFFCQQSNSPPSDRRNPAACWLVPFLVVTATRLLTGLFTTDDFDPLYPVAILAGAAALVWYRGDYLAFSWRLSPVAVAIGAAVFAIWMILPNPGVNPAASGESWFAFYLVARGLGYVAVTPVIEELAFRGYLARRLTAADFESVSFQAVSWPAIIGSSIAFAALHGAHWPGAAVAGFAYAWAARRSGKIIDAITAHAATNVLLAAAAIGTGSWWLMS
jgi:exosortase E/protease (VPEID-CTERM system)